MSNDLSLDTVLEAVDVEIDQALVGDLAGVPTGLTNLGWRAAAVVGRDWVVDRIWSHDACNVLAHAQTGVGGADFYLGLIANFDGDGDAEAEALLGRIYHRIHPRLSAAGFALRLDEEQSVHTWSDGQTAVELSLLRQIFQRTHTVPSAVQFAVQPLKNYSAPPTAEVIGVANT